MAKRRKAPSAPGVHQPEFPLAATTKRPPSGVLPPEAAARLAIARRAKPSAVPDHVRLVLTLELRRELAEKLSERAIRQERNIEAVIIALLEVAAEEMAVSHDELQARIRALIASGDLPDERPQVHEVSERLAGFRSEHRPTCLICREPDATLAYFWIGGRVAYLHAACDALWKQERERQEGT